MTNYAFRDVVPHTKTNTVGRTETFNLAQDINKQSRDDIQRMLKTITSNETERQERLGNPPVRVIVDRNEGKSFAAAENVVEVLFGNKLTAAAMVAVEQALFDAIRKATGPRTGMLANRDLWEWKYIAEGRERVLNGPQDIPSLRRGDRLILRPKLAYATIVNNIVAAHGRVSFTSRGQKIPMGFLGYAAQKAKRKGVLRNFTVYAYRDPSVVTRLVNVRERPDTEQSQQGTGFIAIRAGRARRYRKLI